MVFFLFKFKLAICNSFFFLIIALNSYEFNTYNNRNIYLTFFIGNWVVWHLDGLSNEKRLFEFEIVIDLRERDKRHLISIWASFSRYLCSMCASECMCVIKCGCIEIYLFCSLRNTTNNIVDGWQVGWTGQFGWIGCKRCYIRRWCNWTQLWRCYKIKSKLNTQSTRFFVYIRRG